MSKSGKEIVNAAIGELSKTDETRYGAEKGELWCSEFVSWVYWQAGYAFTGGPAGKRWHLSNVKKIKKWFKNNSTFISKSDSNWSRFTPTVGDYACFGNKDDPESHSGLVERLESNGTLHTIEGGRGDIVARYVYPNFKTSTSFSKWVQGMGLRCGMQIKIANGKASASSSGDNRQPKKAFDGKNDTWWRNRTKKGRGQYLQMEWSSKKKITKISLRFGNHYLKNYRFYFKRYRYTGGLSLGMSPTWAPIWIPSTTIKNNPKKERAHVWFRPKKDVYGVRIKCLEYSKDDYFSIIEMKIQR